MSKNWVLWKSSGGAPGGAGRGRRLGLREGNQSPARSSRSECNPLWTGSPGWPAPQGAPGCSWRPRWSANDGAKVRGRALSEREAKRNDRKGLGTYFNGLLQVVFDVLHFGGLLTTVGLKREKKFILHHVDSQCRFNDDFPTKIVFCFQRSGGFRSVLRLEVPE